MSENAQTPNDMLKLDEVATILNLSKALVNKLVTEKKIPAFRPSPKVIRVKRCDLEAYIASKTEKTIS